MSAEPILIVHIIYQLGVGGLENGVVNLINRLPKDRYRHAIISLTDSTDFSARIKRPDVAVFEMHKQPGQDWASFVNVFRILKQLKPQIVHTRNLAPLEYQLCALAAGVRYRIHGEHGWDVFDPDGSNRKYQWLRRILSVLVHRFIPLSIQLQDYLQHKVGIPASKISRICNGVDTDKFYPAGHAKVSVKDCPLSTQHKVVIGTVGRMHGVKDQLTLVRAFIQACQQSQAFADRCCLILIGEGPLRAPARELLFEAGLADKTWLPGERNDIADLLRSLDIFVLPSKAEGISNTILEAMASGLPVIATEVGGNAELVVHAKTGLLVPPEQVDDMAQALTDLALDSDKRQKFAQAGLERIRQHFSIANMLAQYQAVYDRAF